MKLKDLDKTCDKQIIEYFTKKLWNFYYKHTKESQKISTWSIEQAIINREYGSSMYKVGFDWFNDRKHTYLKYDIITL